MTCTYTGVVGGERLTKGLKVLLYSLCVCLSLGSVCTFVGFLLSFLSMYTQGIHGLCPGLRSSKKVSQ